MLYKVLVEPAQPRIHDKKKLIIVPDGFLFEFPYEVLLSGQGKTDGGWSELPFLARSFTTIYAPSASVYAALAQTARRNEYALDLLALGNPDYSTLTPRDPGDEKLAALRARTAHAQLRTR